MQGLSHFVPTQTKIEYINLLLNAGFDTLDFGSFVSAKAIPQMADTAEVLDKLEYSKTATKLLAIVANQRGVEQAISYKSISYLGFPLSISETFQQRNTNSSIKQGLDLVKNALELCDKNGKELVVYLSMAFGNPYGDPYSTQIVSDYAGELSSLGCKIVSLADTVGLASPTEVSILGKAVIGQFSEIEIGMHLHTKPDEAFGKIKAALESGCKRIDTALGGLGGCPFAEDELTGNMPTEALVKYCKQNNITTELNLDKLQEAHIFLNNSIISNI